MLERVIVRDQTAEIDLQISAREGGYTPADRSLVLKIHGQQKAPQAIQAGGRATDVGSDPGALAHAAEGAAYDADARVVWIKVPDKGTGLEARINK